MVYSTEKLANKEVHCFDVCGTLYYQNTTLDFIDFFFEKRKKTVLKLIRQAPFRLISKATFLFTGFDLIRTLAMFSLKGYTEEEIRTKSKEYVSALDEKRIVIGHQLLEQAKSNGVDTVLISASLDVVVEQIALTHGINAWYSSKLGFENGICTGRLINDLYGRKDKAIMSLQKVYSTISYVTDNFNDINLLNWVDVFQIITYRKDVRYWTKNAPNCVIYEK